METPVPFISLSTIPSLICEAVIQSPLAHFLNRSLSSFYVALSSSHPYFLHDPAERSCPCRSMVIISVPGNKMPIQIIPITQALTWPPDRPTQHPMVHHCFLLKHFPKQNTECQETGFPISLHHEYSQKKERRQAEKKKNRWTKEKKKIVGNKYFFYFSYVLNFFFFFFLPFFLQFLNQTFSFSQSC